MILKYQVIIYTLFILMYFSCKEKYSSRKDIVASYNIEKTIPEEIIPGAERLALYYPKLQGKKVACVVNHTSKVGELHLIDTLLKLEIEIKKVFAPEHGFRGNLSDGEIVENAIDKKTGLPILSLYGKNKKPQQEDLENIDVVLFDIQDVGARFYTYLSTLHYVMEACAENNIPVIVLDRPNPHTDYIDGPILDLNFSSFVGLHPVPVVYGMTIGEYAKMINGEGWLKNNIQVDLTVVQIKNFNRSDFYNFPVKPSPNLPNMQSILLYPSLCFFEGTTISVGRGTDKQFQVLGNPELKGTFAFTPKPNEGSKYPPHEGKLCFGEDLSTLTLGSLLDENKLNLHWLMKYYEKCKENNTPFFLESNHFTRLAGTDKLKKQIISGKSEAEIRGSWQKELKEFNEIRNKYLIYPAKDNSR